MQICPSSFILRKPFLSIAIKKKVKFDGARCLFSTFLRLQGDHHCACAQKWCHFSFFPRAFKQNKIKAVRPKMTKIASKGGGGPALVAQNSFSTKFHYGEEIRKGLRTRNKGMYYNHGPSIGSLRLLFFFASRRRTCGPPQVITHA